MTTDSYERLAFAATSGTDPDDLDTAKRHTHDQVIDALGDARTGPVSWRILTPDHGLRFLRGLSSATGGREMRDLASYLRRHPHGRLVIASAPAHPSAVPEERR